MYNIMKKIFYVVLVALCLPIFLSAKENSKQQSLTQVPFNKVELNDNFGCLV